MNDPSGVQSALGIEGAEWFAEGRPLESAAAAEGITARRLGGSELALETARLHEAEARALAGRLGQRIEQLEQRLEDERRDSARLATALLGHERARRGAEQRAHAETALRNELEERLGGRERDRQLARRALGDLAAAEERMRELESELEHVRRRADEAEQAAAAAEAVRARAQRQADDAARGAGTAALGPPGSDHTPVTGSAILERERELVALRARKTRRVPSEPPAPPPTAARADAGEPVAAELADVQLATIDALQREVQTRAATEARLRAELITAQGKLEARLAIESGLSLTLSELRGELERLRSAVSLEGAARVESERRAAQLEHDDPATVAESAPPVQPERLTEALSRLRETIPVQPPPDEPRAGATRAAGAALGEPSEPAGAGRAWLEPVFRSLVRRDAPLAGRLLLDLLPAQRAAYPRPVAYDLALGEHRCVQVTVFGGPPQIRFADVPRPASVTDFKIVGDAARLARLLAAGRIRARLGFGVARVRGRREALSALRALVQAPLALSDLHRAGVRPEPALALEVAALMVDPRWTVGERFSIAHEQHGRRTGLLHVRNGLPVAASEAWPADSADTTIACPAELLLDVLSGRDPQALEVRGDERPLGLLRGWLERAQSG